MPLFYVSMPRFQAFCLNTKFQSVKSTLCHSYGIFKISFKPSLPIKNLIKPVLVVWRLSCKSCRMATARPKDSNNKKPIAICQLMRFFIITAYCLYPKPFKRNWLAVITTIFWPAILISKKRMSYWHKNTMSQPSAIMSRPT